MRGKIPRWRARNVAKLVGCDESSVLEILEGWKGQRLSQMTDEHIAGVITALLDSFVEEP